MRLYQDAVRVEYRQGTTSLILQCARCTCSQHNQKRNALQTEKKHLQIKTTTFGNLTTHTLQMLTTQPNKETHCKYNLFGCIVSIYSVFLYLFVL